MGVDWKAFCEAWSRHDWAAVADFFTDDGVYEDRAQQTRAQGRKEIRDGLAHWSQTFSSDNTLEVTDSIEIADRYGLEWIMRGTHDGSSPALPATGKSFVIQGASMGRLEGGRIAENRDYWNVADFLGQVGLMTSASGAGS
jgi:steroid delta-isomerase-like uncharacterized protein